MATDVVLDQETIKLIADFLEFRGVDVRIDNPGRRRGGGNYRRAVVHDFQDGITLNWERDYPGGVTVNDANLVLRVHAQDGAEPKLPKTADVGTVLLLVNSTKPRFGAPETHVSLWICVPTTAPPRNLARWRPLSLGDEVMGAE